MEIKDPIYNKLLIDQQLIDLANTEIEPKSAAVIKHKLSIAIPIEYYNYWHELGEYLSDVDRLNLPRASAKETLIYLINKHITLITKSPVVKLTAKGGKTLTFQVTDQELSKVRKLMNKWESINLKHFIIQLVQSEGFKVNDFDERFK